MKNNKFLYGLFAVCACAVSAYLFHELLAWFAPDDLGGVLVAAGSAAATADQTMRGTVLTTKTPKKDGTIEEQDINRPTISKKITKINPSLFPMDTILREIETVPCKSVEYQYYSVRGRGVQSKIKTAYAVSGEASGAKQITVTNAHIFSVDGNVLFPTFEVDKTRRSPLPSHRAASRSIRSSATSSPQTLSAKTKSRFSRSTRQRCPRCRPIRRSIVSASPSTKTRVCPKTPARCRTATATTAKST